MQGHNGNRNTGLKRLIKATKYSYHGFKACFKAEEAFRQETYLTVILLPLGLWLGNGLAEKGLLAGVMFIVLIVELLNSAIERAIDRISFARHDLSKEAKDMGSTAVLVSVLFAALIWALIGLPRLYQVIA